MNMIAHVNTIHSNFPYLCKYQTKNTDTKAHIIRNKGWIYQEIKIHITKKRNRNIHDCRGDFNIPIFIIDKITKNL